MSLFNELLVGFKSITDDILNTNGFECRKLFYDNEIFYYTRDIMKCLGYNGDKKKITFILKKLRKEDKYTINELEKKFKSTPPMVHPEININQTVINSLNPYEKNYLFVNKQGLFYLIGNSNKEGSREFKNFIYYTLLPTLYDKHEELINKKNNKINEVNEVNTKIDKLISTVETIKLENKKLLKNIEIIKQDTIDLKGDHEVFNDELNNIKDELNNIKDEQVVLIQCR